MEVRKERKQKDRKKKIKRKKKERKFALLPEGERMEIM